jgi:acyl-CoA hydrolase
VRIVSADKLQQALRALPGVEPRAVASGNLATPHALLDALAAARERYRLFMLAAHAPLPAAPRAIFETPFVGPGMRDAGARLDYLPMRLSLVPRLFATARPPDVVLLHTSTPRAARVSLGIEVNILPAAVEAVRARGGLVVAQLNPRMPHTLGDAELDTELIDLAIEVEEELAVPLQHTPHEHAERIAAHVAELVPDRATLQLGIGQVPDAALRALATRSGLRVWSEMVSDGVLELERAGALDRSAPIVCSFMFGSRALYDWVHGNPRVQMRRTEAVNDPAHIAARPRMISVNTALQVDLHDQAGASHIGGRLYSGFGGQPDFVEGALRSPGGHAVIALCSWHPRSRSSTIVPSLRDPITSFQHSAVITEHGAAHLFGRSQRAQAELIVEHAAHPDAREWLREQAALLGLARGNGDAKALPGATVHALGGRAR